MTERDCDRYLDRFQVTQRGVGNLQDLLNIMLPTGTGRSSRQHTYIRVLHSISVVDPIRTLYRDNSIKLVRCFHALRDTLNEVFTSDDENYDGFQLPGQNQLGRPPEANQSNNQSSTPTVVGTTTAPTSTTAPTTATATSATTSVDQQSTPLQSGHNRPNPALSTI